ncbi:beta-ketoacyl synthase N-terminal-like domain-containing protein [Allostreptomyces psammosilenae]|uniref:Acyl-CoA synthetase (AMP-forming)/AMP-acid ligase II/3-oxoacyl-(Acyl-carrier-protein) synthase/acyl carrier protein n=1 Tax=Allostreptomyces psammosilenae TaxID=1892865 RepID=A0A853A0H1_9ACTN|nr:beta-ketoacyl synthase N-terminal-like domain-containing protein [Allostreptomyces psammosilenae]NYI04012.1 acyl-CoA synthetase (AMP-forming)/AMP-acid ligase II/3-oxoacyl-(acyl-carrier-protein) synthase/acyl carrier protein [Allostreptomyces psammosilenae]
MSSHADARFLTLVEVLRHRAEHHPDGIAYRFLTFSGTREPQVSPITYRELDAWARAVAVTLRSAADPGDRALMLCPPGLEYVAYFYGSLYAGLIPVPAYPPGTAKHAGRVEAIAKASDARIVLVGEGTEVIGGPSSDGGEAAAAGLSALARARWLPTESQIVDGREDDWSPPAISDDTVAFLQYTSGSTSTPKGVMVTHGNLIANARAQAHSFNLDDTSEGVSWLPPYHDMGLIGGIICPMNARFTMNLMAPVSFVREPAVWLEAITRYRATVSPGPNFAYQMCVERVSEEVKDQLDLSNWVSALNGAEPVQPEVLDRFSEAFARCGFKRSSFYPCYGLAEGTLLVSGGHAPGDSKVRYVSKRELEAGLVRPPDDIRSVQALASSGEITVETEVAIVDRDAHTALPEGSVGEIWVRGTSVAPGYWRAPEATEETFGAFLAGGEGPYLRTGDLGVMMDGELFVTGRAKDLMIFRGRNVYPQDVEATCSTSHPGLAAVRTAAFSVEVDGEDSLVIVQEIPRTRVGADEAAAIVAAIRRRVSEEHQLQAHDIVLVPPRKIPTTSSGKVQRSATKALYREGGLPAARITPAATPAPPAAEAPKAPEAPKSSEERAAAPAAEAPATPAAAPRPSGDRSAAAIENQFRILIARQAHLDVSEVDVRQPFTSYGLDSIQAVALAGALTDWLGREVPATLAWDYPSVEEAARALAAEIARTEQASPQAAAEAAGARTATGTPTDDDAVAVVGIGCRFPGAAGGADAFWDLLAGGRSGIVEVPADRWKLEELFDPDPGAPGRTYSRHGGFVDGVRQFDPSPFGIPAQEALSIDPQHRMVLEVAWEALEHAGMAPDSLRGSHTGVFIGMAAGEYERLSRDPADLSRIDAYTATGNAANFGANRLSYVLGLQGPSMVVDTACSSSLVALHLACQSLRAGESELALAGGVSLLLSPDTTVALSSGRMLSPEGRCKTFDASADGYVRGEGCGVVVLKRLSDALADGDDVLAVIRGSAVNQDGKSNGLTAPNGLAQQDVVRRALAAGRIDPGDVGYVEAHGTGTPLGDPVEVRALGRVLGEGRPAHRPVALGSVKTNIGHLEAAAGIAGFIKAVLAVYHAQIPPHLNLTTPNPHVAWDELPVTVPTELTDWTDPRRVAGVSAFGFGGTNAHMVIESPPVLAGAPARASESLKETV